MTLVVTEVSEEFGCVIVGDSAVTIGTEVIYGAEKIHFSSAATLGFALWGNACLAGRRVDELVSDFVTSLGSSATPRSAGRELAALLAREGTSDGRDWLALRGGVHVCGYENSVPVLFHVHTGPEPPAPQSPFQLYEDVPDARLGFHLRNGYYKMFSGLFDGMQHYAAHLQLLGYKWPTERVEDRVSYYTILVDTVARTLEAAGRVPAVGGMIASFAFNRSGLQIDKRTPRGTTDFCHDGNAIASFCELPSNLR
jgi:hypothetical protein